ncbi:hypothetical protein A4G29_06870 [Mycobacterium kansasii]|nr:hypothetical protein A4G29_06870 [Mycobacterium kansasii]
MGHRLVTARPLLTGSSSVVGALWCVLGSSRRLRHTASDSGSGAAAARAAFVAGPRRAVATVIGVIGVIGFEGGRRDQHRPGPSPRQVLPAEPPADPLEHIHCDSLRRRNQNYDGGNEIAGPDDRL